MDERKADFVEPELVKYEEVLAEITQLVGYGDIIIDDAAAS